MVRLVLLLIALIALGACLRSSLGSVRPLSTAALTDEYEKSRAEVRRKYDGKNIVVTGYAAADATMPKNVEDQGSVFLTEKDVSLKLQVTCWFSRDQTVEFSRLKAGQHLTVKGVFNGEAGPELRFCKLLKLQ